MEEWRATAASSNTHDMTQQLSRPSRLFQEIFFSSRLQACSSSLQVRTSVRPSGFFVRRHHSTDTPTHRHTTPGCHKANKSSCIGFDHPVQRDEVRLPHHRTPRRGLIGIGVRRPTNYRVVRCDSNAPFRRAGARTRCSDCRSEGMCLRLW